MKNLFYSDLKRGLGYRDDRNCFRFYYLICSHYPYLFDRNLNPVKDDTGTQYDQSVGIIKIVLEFIKQMKLKNVFEESTFAIIADHGGIHNRIGTRPIFLLKKPKENHYVISM